MSFKTVPIKDYWNFRITKIPVTDGEKSAFVSRVALTPPKYKSKYTPLKKLVTSSVG